MWISQTTDRSVTVRRKVGSDSCHCLLRIWQPSNTDPEVYQLLVNRQESLVKIILVEGA